jgi:hypothetical protein
MPSLSFAFWAFSFWQLEDRPSGRTRSGHRDGLISVGQTGPS